MKSYHLFIDGKDVESSNCDYSPIAKEMILNPRATIKLLSKLRKKEPILPEEESKIIGKYYLAEDSDIEKAIDSSSNAFEKFRIVPMKERAQVLVDVHDELKRNKNDFIDLLVKEGHPYKLALWQYENMLDGTSKDNVKLRIDQIEQTYSVSGEKIILTKKPDGVVLVIPPRNAPASNSFLALSALINGNVLLIKPPQQLPISTIYLWKNIVNKVIDKKGFSKGIINIIQGNSSKIVDKCLDSEKVKTVLIFGESQFGVNLGKKVYERSKKPILELSGNDLFIVWKDSKLGDKLFDSALEAFLGSTQICMVPKIFLIHHEIYDKFIEMFKGKLSQVKAGLPDDKSTWLSPVGKKKEYFSTLEDGILKGAKLFSGGNSINHKGEPDENGMFISPTLLRIEDAEKFADMDCFKNEIFFPLIPVVKVGSANMSDEQILDKIEDLSNKNRFGLRTSIWARNANIINNLISRINNSGSIRVNSSHIGYSKYMATHGGTGLTGGAFGELNYMCLRAAHLQGISIKKND